MFLQFAIFVFGIAAFAAGVTVLRRTGLAFTASMLTALLGFASLIFTHVAPFFALEWYWALGAVVVGQLIGGFIGNILLLPYMRSIDWPENIIGIARFGPPFSYLIGLIVSIATLVKYL